MLVSWNVLLQRLANVRLQNGPDEFCWNLHENSKKTTPCNTLIQPDIPINKSNDYKLWKLKIPLRIKVFEWYQATKQNRTKALLSLCVLLFD
jgi:hypothetical protein